MEINFLGSLIPDRFRIILETQDMNYIYQLIAKHYRCNPESLKSRYEISYRPSLQSISFVANYQDSYELFSLFNQYGVRYESVTPTQLIVDLNELLNKIK